MHTGKLENYEDDGNWWVCYQAMPVNKSWNNWLITQQLHIVAKSIYIKHIFCSMH